MSVTDGIGQTPCSFEHYLVYYIITWLRIETGYGVKVAGLLNRAGQMDAIVKKYSIFLPIFEFLCLQLYRLRIH